MFKDIIGGALGISIMMLSVYGSYVVIETLEEKRRKKKLRSI